MARKPTKEEQEKFNAGIKKLDERFPTQAALRNGAVMGAVVGSVVPIVGTGIGAAVGAGIGFALRMKNVFKKDDN